MCIELYGELGERATVQSHTDQSRGVIVADHNPGWYQPSMIDESFQKAFESAARIYGLDFIPMTFESYDLVFPQDIWENAIVLALLDILASKDFRHRIEAQGGYDATQAGAVEWIG